MPLPKSDIEQLNIPPNLPLILKQYCKSAIRTQPYDLLKWSHAYFQALARGEEPPVKQRLEYPSRNQDCASTTSAHGLTLGFLKVLYRQLGGECEFFFCSQSLIGSQRFLTPVRVCRRLQQSGAVGFDTRKMGQFVSGSSGFESDKADRAFQEMLSGEEVLGDRRGSDIEEYHRDHADGLRAVHE